VTSRKPRIRVGRGPPTSRPTCAAKAARPTPWTPRRSARAARGLQDKQLRRPRSGGDRTALRILTTACDQMAGERTRAVNALTALLRTNDLGGRPARLG
jgi:hypothetical protein